MEHLVWMLLWIGGGVTTSILIGRWVLGPIDAAARHRLRPVQFTMADFLCLIFLVQLPMAVIAAFVPDDEPGWWWLSIFGWVACGAMWWTSVVKLSKAGIRSAWQRSVFLALILPLAYFGTIVWAMLWLRLAADALGAPFGSHELQRIAFVQVALTASFYSAGRFTRRMAADAEPPKEPVTLISL